MMTKKHFQQAAERVCDYYIRADGDKSSFEFQVALILEKTFIEFFQDENPRFDVNRFKEACQP